MDFVRLASHDPVKIAEGPGRLPPTFRNMSGFDRLPAKELRKYGWFRFHRDPTPDADPHAERIEWRLSLEGNVVRSRALLKPKSEAEIRHALAERRRERLEELSARRRQAETGTMKLGDVLFHTGRNAMAALSIAAQVGEGRRWKGADGHFHDLSAGEIQQAARHVSRHAQACFDNEDRLQQALREADTLPALEAVDLEEGWP